jgi:hypothetical protein
VGTLKTKSKRAPATKKIVPTKVLADYFAMSNSDVCRNLRRGVRLDFVYIVFEDESIPRKKKREYLYNTSIDEKTKDNIWQRYIGDWGFPYCQEKGFEEEL